MSVLRRRPNNPRYERARLMDAQGGLCHWCGKRMDMNSKRPDGQPGADYPTFEHVTPRRDGGITSRENLALAHLKCNQATAYFGRPDLYERRDGKQRT